jgi:hypothetical protein
MLLDDNRPAHLQSRDVQGAVAASEGPYASSGDWWDQQRWSRVEWDVELEDSAVARCHQHRAGWALDGVYD